MRISKTMKFIGRINELQELERLYRLPDGQCVVIYGRRRIGKSTLIEKFVAHKAHISIEGLEGEQTKEQIKQVTHQIFQQLNEPLAKQLSFTDWNSLFDYLTRYFEQQKRKIIFSMDEFQWLAANRSKLVSLIKLYWDKHWKKQNVMLILCGSISSYMVKRVIHSKALYGRVNWELCLSPLAPNEIYQLLDGKRSRDEALLYALILGGIPKYLQEIDPNKSFDQNMNRLFFIKNGLFVKEYDRVFFSQFKEYKTYEAIVLALQNGVYSLEEISKYVNISSGGGLKIYLKNLEQTSFISSYIPYNKGLNSKLIKYKLTDEYLRFYFKYVEPNLKLISQNNTRNLFSEIIKSSWSSWLGFAFENFCLKNALYMANLMGFSDQVLHFGPLFHKTDQKFQIDLVFVRQDKVITVCELKYHSEPISTAIVPEIERKCKLISVPHGYTIEKALISRFGMDKALSALNYFHHAISVDDFFNT